MKHYYVYILASKRNGTLYVGFTGDLVKRINRHKGGTIDGFTKKYTVKNLVYFEETTDVNSAIAREKQLKNWHRSWKVSLVEDKNPEWKDLHDEFLDSGSSPE